MGSISEETAGKTKIEVGENDKGGDFIEAFNDSFINSIDSFSAVNEMQMDNNGNITMNGEEVDIRTEQEYKIDELVSEGMNRLAAYAEVKLESIYEGIKEEIIQEIKEYIEDIKAEIDSGKSPLEALIQIHVVDPFLEDIKMDDIKAEIDAGKSPLEAFIKVNIIDSFIEDLKIEEIKGDMMGNIEEGIAPMSFGEALIKEFIIEDIKDMIEDFNDKIEGFAEIKEEIIFFGEQLEAAIIEEIEKYLD